MKLNDYCEALKNYEMAMKQGLNNIKEESKLLPFKNDIQKWIQACQDKVNKSVPLNLSEKSESEMKDVNETIPSLSSGVEIVHNGKVRTIIIPHINFFIFHFFPSLLYRKVDMQLQPEQ